MKKLKSTVEGTWVELIPIVLTSEQKALLISPEASDRVARVELEASIKAQREATPSSEDVVIAEAAYVANKPILEEGDTYQLIAVDMTLDNSISRGIINCRVNGEHQQIRF